MTGRDRRRSKDPTPARPKPRTFAEVFEEMGDLEPIEPADTDEPDAEPARRPGLGAREMRGLRAGRLRPDDRVDLHGLTRDAARERLRAALPRMAEAGTRCVLVIHGRGLRSKEGEAILKAALQPWFEEPPLDAIVIATAPAQPRDGGEGATYVVLR